MSLLPAACGWRSCWRRRHRAGRRRAVRPAVRLLSRRWTGRARTDPGRHRRAYPGPHRRRARDRDRCGCRVKALTPSNDGAVAALSLDVADDAGGERRSGSGESLRRCRRRSAPHHRRRLARVGRDAGQRSVPEAAGILVGAVGGPEAASGRSASTAKNAAAANPTIVGDRVFVGSGSGRVYALGLKDGCTHWTFKADGGVRASIVVGDSQNGARPRPTSATSARFVYSVDATTGALQWKKQIDEPPRRAGHRLAGALRRAPVTCRCRRSRKRPERRPPTNAARFAAASSRSIRRRVRAVAHRMITETPTPRAKNAKGAQL